MTPRALEEWIDAREPAPPGALVDRLRELARSSTAEAATPEALLQGTGSVLERLLRHDETSRGSALELLAADALATYAMEAACDAPESLESRCEWAMRYFAGIADSA